jgi:hypothetical protein
LSHALVVSAPSAPPRSRGTAYPVIERCLEEQGGKTSQGWFGRSLGLNPLRRAARPWYERARRELEVSGMLAELGPGWNVLNVVPDGVKDSVVDQVIVGPSGIFTVSIRNFVGKKLFASGTVLTANGFKTNHMADARTAARQLEELLFSTTGNEIPVTPLVVAVGVHTIRGGAKPPVVKVLPASMLALSLAQVPATLEPAAVAHFSAVIEQQLGLGELTDAPEETQRHAARFDRLQQAVDYAAYRRRRLALAAGASFALAGPVATFAVTELVLSTMA